MVLVLVLVGLELGDVVGELDGLELEDAELEDVGELEAELVTLAEFVGTVVCVGLVGTALIP